MTRGALILFALILLAASAPARAADPLKYIEIVRENPQCADGACFIEYLFLSSGLAIKKQFYGRDYEKSPAVLSIRRADPARVAALVEQGGAIFADGRASGASSEDNNTLFLYDGAALHAYSVKENPLPAFGALFDGAAAAFDKSGVSPDFYLHEYYALTSGAMEDIHLFSDGSVIFSNFQMPHYSIAATRTFAAPDADAADIRRYVPAALREKGQRYRVCDKSSGLTYGFIEVQMNGAYLHSYTCAEDNAVTALFQRVRGLAARAQ